MSIPFSKAHGARNDFLLTWVDALPESANLPDLARAICDRNTGVGADGWILMDRRPGLRIFNSDGSEPELSGNGTRCAAAFLMERGVMGEEFEIATGAGAKRLRLISRKGREFRLEMNMGEPRVIDLHFPLEIKAGKIDASLIDCGNPQCAMVVESFEFDWAARGAEIERHPHFPNRTNCSFIVPVDDHMIDVRFFERGAGVTMSSGTGSTGAAACAFARGLAKSPLTVATPAGPLVVEQRVDGVHLTGPAVLIADGVFYYEPLS